MSENNLPNYAIIAKQMAQVSKAIKPYMSCLAEIAVIGNKTVNYISSALNTIYPILNELSQYKQVILDAINTCQPVIRAWGTLGLLEKNEYVFWDSLDDELVDDLFTAKNIDDFLLAYSLENNRLENVIEKSIESKLVKKYIENYNESIIAYRNSLYNVALSTLVAVFDGVLSDVSGISKTKVGDRVEKAIDKLANSQEIEDIDFSLLVLVSSFEGTMNLFGAHSNFEEPEPDYLNRHWIAHGRSTKKRTQLDCIKLFRLIYGLILIYNISNDNDI